MYTLKHSVIILILTMIINYSCKESIKEDHSLTIEEYQKLGMPDHNKNWINDDYIMANITLSSLKITDPMAFPRKKSKKSNAIFMRLVNKDNLSFTEDQNIPVRNRAFLVQHYPRFQYELTQLYTDTANVEQYYNEELIETYIFGLNIHGKMLDLAGIIMNSEREEEKSIHSGLTTVVFNYLKTLSNIMEEQVKSNIYVSEDLDRLSLEVSGSLKKNLEWILPTDRYKLAENVQKVIDDAPSDYIKENYRTTLKLLKGN
jgi:hypothetical protein